MTTGTELATVEAPVTAIASGAGGGDWLPESSAEATDWFLARIVSRPTGSRVTDAQAVRIRAVLKDLRGWGTMAKPQQRTLWRIIHGHLIGELEVPKEELARLPEPKPSQTEALKGVHELATDQKEQLAVRRKAALLLSLNLPPVVILKQLGVPRSRAWLYKVKRRAAAGEGGMDDRRTANGAARRYGETHKLLLEQLCFDPLRKPPVSTLHKLLRAKCAGALITEPQSGAESITIPAPSEGWVRRQLRSNPQLTLRHRSGPAEHRRRDRQITIAKDNGVLPGEIYEIDSTPLDVWIRILRPDGEWVPIRPSLTCVIDVGSRAIVGTHLTLGNATQVSVAHAVVHAMLPKEDPAWPMHGKPRTLRLDRGTEYGNDFIAGVEACGVLVEWSPPRCPDARAKGERLFGTLNNHFHGLRGTTKAVGTSDPAVSKHVMSYYTVDELTESIRNHITLEYHRTVHSGTNATPYFHWLKAVRPDDLRDDEMAALLPHSSILTVTHGHLDLQVETRRHTFMADFLGNHLKQKVSIRWLDLDEVYVFEAQTNRFLGKAVSGSHEQAREVTESILASRSKYAAECRELEKRALASSLADASMTPTVMSQIEEHMEEAKVKKRRVSVVQPELSDEAQETRALLEDFYSEQ